MLKKTIAAIGVAMALIMGASAATAEECRWGEAAVVVERLKIYNPSAEVKMYTMNEDVDTQHIIETVVEYWNSQPPQSETIDMSDVRAMFVFDKPGASTVMVIIVGDRCFLGGTELSKTSGLVAKPEQGV